MLPKPVAAAAVVWLARAAIILTPASAGAADTAPTTAAAAARGTPTHAGEPTVSAMEAQLLRQVQAQMEDHPAAAAATIQAAISDDSSPALTFALAVCYQRLEQWQEAEQALRRTLARAPTFYRARDALARILIRRGRHAAAAAELATLLDTAAPDRGGHWKLLAFAYLNQGRPLAAEAACRQALAYLPDDADVRQALLRAVVEQGDLARARPLARATLNAAPQRGELWALLANADLDAGRRDDAIVRLECAYRLGVGNRDARLSLADLLLDSGLTEAAVVRYLDASAGEVLAAGRLLRAAERLLALGQAGAARALLDRVDAATGNVTAAERRTATSLRGRLAEANGDLDGALRIDSELLDRAPVDAPLLLRVAELHRRRGDLVQAGALYERAARAGNEDEQARALVGLARIAVEEDDYARAATMLQRSLRLRRRPHVQRYLEQIRRMLE